MGQIVEKLQSQHIKNIRLNQEVELIYSKGSTIMILCTDGSVYSTKNLICTFSLGVLKECHLSLFSPPLPDGHQTVIENIGSYCNQVGNIEPVFYGVSPCIVTHCLILFLFILKVSEQ